MPEPGTRSDFAARAKLARERADSETDDHMADAHREIAAGYDQLANDSSLDG